MLLPAIILSLLASAAPEQPSPSSPILVTGHAWAPFISPMGEPFRARSTAEDTLAKWFAQADRNHDGVLTVDEICPSNCHKPGQPDCKRNAHCAPCNPQHETLREKLPDQP